MTLTKNDLNAIQKIFEPLAKDLKNVKDDLGGVKKDLKNVKDDLKDVKMRVKKIEKTVDVMARLFNSEDVKLSKRVNKIEDHLGISSKN